MKTKMYSATKAKVEKIGKPLVENLPSDLLSGKREVEIDKIVQKICSELGYTSSSYQSYGKKCYLYNY